MNPRVIPILWLLLPLASVSSACSSDPCPRGQKLRVERFHDSFQARAQGCVDRDDDGHFRRQGRWEWFYETGQKEAEGAYLNGGMDGRKGKTGIPRGGREGPWLFWHENGQRKQQLTYRNGKPEGRGYQWYENGRKQFEATFKAGRPEGPWSSWHAKGQKKEEGAYEDGRPVGIWTAWDESGARVYEGPYRDGVLP